VTPGHGTVDAHHPAPPRRRVRQSHRVGVLSVVVLVALSACADATLHPTPAPGSLSPWARLPSPSPGVPSDLRSVVCGEPISCVAVGSGAATGLPQTLVEVWDGTAWSVGPSPTGGGAGSWLNSVACPSPISCLAVGAYSATGDGDNPQDHTLVETLVGDTWSVIPSPNPGTGDQTGLQSIACTSRTWCVAVGSFSPISDPYDPPSKTLVESWDGTSWTVVPSPGPAVGLQGVLKSVACTSPTDCVAVGSYGTIAASGSRVRHALIETWNGTSWSMVSGLVPGMELRSALQSVACPSPGRCLAVGSYSPSMVSNTLDDQTLVEEWDGAAWSMSPTPNASDAQQSVLQSVSCASPSICLAVGSYGTPTNLDDRQPLAESWQGSQWSLTTSPGSKSELASVACSAPSACIAVGRAGAANGADAETLVDAWRSTQSSQPKAQ
jgi:hypothetical protein